MGPWHILATILSSQAKPEPYKRIHGHERYNLLLWEIYTVKKLQIYEWLPVIKFYSLTVDLGRNDSVSLSVIIVRSWKTRRVPWKKKPNNPNRT